MADILPTPYLSSQAELDRPSRGICWVLGVALAAAVIAAWLMVLLQLAMVIRAELRLQQVIAEASEFAALPAVTRSEVELFVNKRLAACDHTVWKTAASLSDGQLQQLRITLPADEALPSWMRPLAVVLESAELQTSLHRQLQTRTFFAK